MQRPQRQAARDAMSRIHDIAEWENLSENSARFTQIAAQIDHELQAELQQKIVDVRDVDMSETLSEADSSEEDDSFVDKDESDDDCSFSMQRDSLECSSMEDSESVSSCSFHSCTESVTPGAHTPDASQVFAEAALNLQTEELA